MPLQRKIQKFVSSAAISAEQFQFEIEIKRVRNQTCR